MARVKYTTNLDDELLRLAKEKAEACDMDGANAVIEAALRLYFANIHGYASAQSPTEKQRDEAPE